MVSLHSNRTVTETPRFGTCYVPAVELIGPQRKKLLEAASRTWCRLQIHCTPADHTLLRGSASSIAPSISVRVYCRKPRE